MILGSTVFRIPRAAQVGRRREPVQIRIAQARHLLVASPRTPRRPDAPRPDLHRGRQRVGQLPGHHLHHRHREFGGRGREPRDHRATQRDRRPPARFRLDATTATTRTQPSLIRTPPLQDEPNSARRLVEPSSATGVPLRQHRNDDAAVTAPFYGWAAARTTISATFTSCG